MAYIIGMVSQKGGVGKSTLARMMAREFAAGGMSAKIADLDTQQQTCTYWAGRRAENNVEPEIQVQSFASVKTALGEAARFDTLILDGKPNASEQTFEIADAADLVVIPTGQTVDDLHPGVVLAHTLRKRGVPNEKIAFAMFKTTGSERENSAARQYLLQAGYKVLDGEVPVSTGYGSASDIGRAITETSFRTLNERASKLAQSVIDLMATVTERKIAPDVIAENGRADEASMKPIQFRVPEAVFAQFSEQAGREFGFSKGSKSQLFLKMWQVYQGNTK
eukprot:gene18648-18944_t